MTIRVAIHHKTSYLFDRLVSVSPHLLRLRPAPHSRTHIVSYSLKIEPKDHFINWQQDPFGNYQARLVFPHRAQELVFEVEVIADMTAYNPFDFFLEEYAEKSFFTYDAQLKKELIPYLERCPLTPLLSSWVDSVPREKIRTIDFLVMLNQRLQAEITYGLRYEVGIQTPEETLALKKGSCRDTGWLLVQILRHLGLAARFVSGYLVQLTTDVKSLDGPSGPAEDFTDLHAWCEVYIPGAGWVGLDPTSGLFASEGHIPLACTPDPVSAAPITGATDDCQVTFGFSNRVSRIHEDPRVTKPYSEEQWRAIDHLGGLVDQQLQEDDVRLTMGGEPTFVSIDDMDSAQWNTEAMGADKLRLAKDLLLRLKERFAPGGLLHYGQGKWYPGEAIPRWALGCFWRTDGEPLWRNTQWLARVDRNYHHALVDAERFLQGFCLLAGIPGDHIHPAYEDALYYHWRVQSLAGDIDPYQADTKDGAERMRIARVLGEGLDAPRGYALPLTWDEVDECWLSSRWRMRGKRVVLIPGDSPMGLRLPLDALPKPAEDEILTPRDPFAPRAELPRHGDGDAVGSSSAWGGVSQQSPADHRAKGPSDDCSKDNSVRTALCAEVRQGTLHLFLPPIEYLEHYIHLVGFIEKTAQSLRIPVVIEGYEPPRDIRLRKLLVTPDPGVIEVNIHPASSWGELAANTQTLYEEAHQARLGTEKFMLDGRHTGTGGGNHVTLGGASPADSPLLRRPDLLRSLVTYWQHHPGLSYLFSGMFVGPTSQAPRVDEGRDEALYELEIAFQQIPAGVVEQPWLVDRVMRNLLVDITGNTHRAEFCIDKLYSPSSASGRQGLLEFRGFEMPPHAHMALVQVLLLRALVACFWRDPYQGPLVRWGTALHDRFMLPHYVWADVRDVVEEINARGIPFDIDWLLPFEEFRFPHYGRLELDDIHLELRWAIEPWHVLGEEISSFGTARYVDSSIERLQVKVSGFTEGRHLLVCNGRQVPLRSTGCHGEYVAGVRYRAWQPPSALHPTIGIHAPLTFDVVDTWSKRAIGGCTYHVSHPGGLSYEALPVNAFEAECRRVSRFWDYGHTPGPQVVHTMAQLSRGFSPQRYSPKPMSIPVLEAGGEYPHTLDLRAAGDGNRGGKVP